MNDPRKESWVVVINEAAGAERPDSEGRLGRVRDLFRERGVEAEWVVVSGPRLDEAVREALESGATGIILGGGDGSISTVASVLAHGSVPLGILPMGTLNHFSRHLGIPADLAGAVEVIVAGHSRRVDLGEVNGCFFVNNSSIGGYPAVIRHREHQRRRFGRGKWTAFAYAFARFLKRYRTMDVVLQLESRNIARKTPFVFVGNNQYLLNETLTATRDSLTAGCLCVYTARCDHWMQFLRLFGLLLTNRLADAPEFESHCVDETVVRTRHRHLDVSRDGEIHSMEMPLHYRIHPGALSVLVPPAANAS